MYNNARNIMPIICNGLKFFQILIKINSYLLRFHSKIFRFYFEIFQNLRVTIIDVIIEFIYQIDG